MIPRDFEKRPYDCFLSYASEDGPIATRVFDFLTGSGMKVFFDRKRFAAGQPVVEELAQAMAQSKSCLVLLSPRSIQKNYVRHEITCAGRQAVDFSEAFRLVGARLESFDPSKSVEFFGNFSWLELPGGDLSIPAARMALLSIRRSETLPKEGQPQIYVSCSWRDHEKHPREWILKRFAEKGAFLIGDCRDQAAYREEGLKRIRRIMSSCSGFLGIYPLRTDPTKTPDENYKYFPDELALAQELGLSVKGYCVDPAVLPRTLAGKWTVIPPPKLTPELDPDKVDQEIADFVDDVRKSTPHAFLATDHKRSLHRNEAARDIIEHLMGMRCTLGKEVSGGDLRRKLIEEIRAANIVIADVACAMTKNGDGLEVNINTCIEAGIAMAANKPLFITSLDPTLAGAKVRKTEAIPFFFRDHAIEWYSDDLSFLAKVHRIAMERRRRILNDEIA
jgi:hypothetical protein